MASLLSLRVVLLFMLVFALHESPSRATDTITANQSLAGHQKLISQNEKFAFGFFKPVEGFAGKWYLGIWFNKIPVQSVVWVANRDKPLFDPTSSNLTISDDGNIVLLDQSKSPVWSTNINNTAPKSTVVVLLNTGNLVIRHESNTSGVLWQSFDHFTNTLLPGNKITHNKKTGEFKQIISWKNRGDPAPGKFSSQLDPNGSKQSILLWNRSVVYWASGSWTGNSFTGVPETTFANNNSAYTFQFVDNDQEAYFMYNITDDKLLIRNIVDVSGQNQGWVWSEAAQAWVLMFAQPKGKCTVYSICGVFSKCTENAFSTCSCIKGFSEVSPTNWQLGDQTAGCKRNVPLHCGNNSMIRAKKDRFYVLSSVELPDNPHIIAATTIHDCELICLNNCSCTAYSYNGTCLLWYQGLLNLQERMDMLGDNIFVRLAASELPDSRTKKWWIVAIITGGLVILGVGITTLYFLIRKRENNRRNHVGESLVTFRYSDLQSVTKNFSEKLGTGSFGSVFKGVLPDATLVAVKKLEGLHQGEKQFRAEVSTIGTIHHKNLVRLLGFCSEGERRLLVYEYMPNGSLDQHLFRGSSEALSWHNKYQIAIGIAKGLAYLHEECRDCIIHCDVKPQNILLDESFVPKVADFGLAKLLGRDFSRVLTSMRGTVGYLAPEWISGEPITTKADVFSYGMMLFEIISGRRNAEQRETSEVCFFPLLVARKLLDGEVHTLLSFELAGNANSEELERVCRVACWCIQDNECSRPTMREIVQVLEELVDVGVPPVPRYLQVLAERADHVKFTEEPSS